MLLWFMTRELRSNNDLQNFECPDVSNIIRSSRLVMTEDEGAPALGKDPNTVDASTKENQRENSVVRDFIHGAAHGRHVFKLKTQS